MKVGEKPEGGDCLIIFIFILIILIPAPNDQDEDEDEDDEGAPACSAQQLALRQAHRLIETVADSAQFEGLPFLHPHRLSLGG